MSAFKILRAANEARNREWDPEGKVTLSFRAAELAGETGEACNIAKKIERERMGMRGSRATAEELADELADIIISADNMAMDLGIDLEAAIERKFNRTSEKHGFATRLSFSDPKPDLPDLSDDEIEVLEALYEGAKRTPARKWEEWQAVRNLVQRGFVSDIYRQDDYGRTFQVTLTPRGMNAIREVRRARAAQGAN